MPTKEDKAVGDEAPMKPRSFPPAVTAQHDGNYVTASATDRAVVRHMAVQADGDLIDAHGHPTGYAPHDMAVQGSLVDSLRYHLELMDVAGVSGALLMPIPTRVKDERVWSRRSVEDPDHLNARSYYTDPSVRAGVRQLDSSHAAELRTVQQVYAPRDNEYIAALAALSPGQRGRFMLMLTGFDLGDAQEAHNWDLRVAEATRNGVRVAGAGELTLHKEVVEGQVPFDPERANQPGSPFMQLLERIGTMGGAVTIHCDIDDYARWLPGHDGQAAPARDGRADPAYLAYMHRLWGNIAQLPEARRPTVVWAHAGGLGRFVQPGDRHADDMRDMLQQYPFLHVDLSWDAASRHLLLADPGQVASRVRLMNDHADRFLWGSDALVPRTIASLRQPYEIYAAAPPVGGDAGARPPAFFDRLAPGVADKIKWGNAERIFGAAAQSIARYAKERLPHDFAARQRRVEESRGTPNVWPSGAGGPMLRSRL